jgi:hypothetical protein
MRDDNPVFGAAHARRVGLDEHLHRSGVQRPPAAPSLAGVVACATAQAHPAPAPSTTRRTHSHEQQLLACVAR